MAIELGRYEGKLKDFYPEVVEREEFKDANDSWLNAIGSYYFEVTEIDIGHIIYNVVAVVPTGESVILHNQRISLVGNNIIEDNIDNLIHVNVKAS